MSQPKVLVLCHGNVCRSPLAEVVMRDAGLEQVRSAGFGAHGRRAAKKVRDWADANEFLGALDDHRSRRVNAEDVDWADRVLVMDGGNERRYRAEFPDGPPPERLATWGDPPGERIRDPAFMAKGSEEFARTLRGLALAARRCAAGLAVENERFSREPK